MKVSTPGLIKALTSISDVQSGPATLTSTDTKSAADSISKLGTRYRANKTKTPASQMDPSTSSQDFVGDNNADGLRKVTDQKLRQSTAALGLRFDHGPDASVRTLPASSRGPTLAGQKPACVPCPARLIQLSNEMGTASSEEDDEADVDLKKTAEALLGRMQGLRSRHLWIDTLCKIAGKDLMNGIKEIRRAAKDQSLPSTAPSRAEINTLRQVEHEYQSWLNGCLGCLTKALEVRAAVRKHLGEPPVDETLFRCLLARPGVGWVGRKAAAHCALRHRCRSTGEA